MAQQPGSILTNDIVDTIDTLTPSNPPSSSQYTYTYNADTPPSLKSVDWSSSASVYHFITSSVASSYFVRSLSFLDSLPIIGIHDTPSIQEDIRIWFKSFIVITCLALFFSLILVPCIKKSITAYKEDYIRGSRILLLGPSGSGKTLLFHVLQDGNTQIDTVTSTEPNQAIFAPYLLSKYAAFNTPAGAGQRAIEESIQSFEFIDSPGHPSLQQSIIDKYIFTQTGGVRAILFLIPSTIVNDSKELQYTSQLLYTILTSKNLVDAKVPMLLVVNHFHNNNTSNKATTSAASASIDNKTIIRQLESMIEKSRKQHTSLPSHTGATAELSDISGENSVTSQHVPVTPHTTTTKPFEFDDASLPTYVTSSIDVKNNKVGEIVRFLSRV